MRSYSSLPDNILYELCITAAYNKSQRKLSSVNKRTRLVATPILFRNVQHCALGGSHLWESLLKKIKILLSSKEISFVVRRFDLTSEFYPGHEYPMPGTVLHSILYGFPNLVELHLALQYEYRASVRVPSDIIKTTSDPTVNTSNEGKTLKLPPLCSVTLPSPTWLRLAPLFPNLHSLKILYHDSSLEGLCADIKPYMDYKRVSELYPNLKKLHTADPPRTNVVKEIAKYFPHIEDLGLFGWIPDHHMDGGILQHLHNFNHFTNIRSLSFTDKYSLGLKCFWLKIEPGWDIPRDRIYLDCAKNVDLQSLIEGVETTIIQDGSQCRLRRLTVGDTVYVQSNEGTLILSNQN